MAHVRHANEQDVLRLTELAQAAPDGLISEPENWTHRLGDATGPHASLTLLATLEPDGPAAGFLWADNAMRVDFHMPLPWLCLNALYVTPIARGSGLGSALVAAAVARAVELEMTTVHGQCLPDVAGWWRYLGFEVTEVDGDWLTPVWVDGKRLEIGSTGNCPFWRYLSSPGEIRLTSNR